MSNSIKIFEEEYDSESLCDVSRDVHEAFDANFNDVVKQIAVDEFGFQEGTFKVSIEWIPPKKIKES